MILLKKSLPWTRTGTPLLTTISKRVMGALRGIKPQSPSKAVGPQKKDGKKMEEIMKFLDKALLVYAKESQKNITLEEKRKLWAFHERIGAAQNTLIALKFNYDDYKSNGKFKASEVK
jgi:hypothetical protein